MPAQTPLPRGPQLRILKPTLNLLRRGVFALTFAEYYADFTGEGIRTQVDRFAARGGMPAPRRDRVHQMLDIAASIDCPCKMAVPYPLLNQILIYHLFLLDCHHFFMMPGRFNVELRAHELIQLTLDWDIHMRRTNSNLVKISLLVVFNVVAISYAAQSMKRVEISNLLNMPQQYHSLDNIQQMLRDCRHFSRNAYDRRILTYLNSDQQKASALRTPRKRAF